MTTSATAPTVDDMLVQLREEQVVDATGIHVDGR